MAYNFSEIEPKWQSVWKSKNTYQVSEKSDKPKFYILDMFPYPSGAGLHVGHPLGYIASDIYARYKRLKGFNVLHPMGYDAFGLPAEQYAIQTGQHPAVTTETNLNRYREQLDKIGFSFDWSREIRTCDSSYYKWTQWMFLELYTHWYDNKTQKAQRIELLKDTFSKDGSAGVDAANSLEESFSAAQWSEYSEAQREEILLKYRLAYLADASVNWCPALGTVLANDEVKDGLSVRGGHPVEQKVMKQWLLRVSAYSQRLLDGLETIDWSDSIKEIQKNWIGRSEGASVSFKIDGKDESFDVFTTRPDTIYGVTFMVLAPESDLVDICTTQENQDAIAEYVKAAGLKTELDRQQEKKVSGQFTGSYCINPVTNQKIPIYISEYVLAGYGTGAIMAVPAHDSRDHAFAKKFELPIIEVIQGGEDIQEQAYESKDGVLVNSELINGLKAKQAISKMIEELEKSNVGTKKINYRLRDAIFSRQRYWGEPIPVYYKDGIPYPMKLEELPLELPEVDKFLPTEDGDAPLGRAKNWKTKEGYPIELTTMPGFAGSSAYYLRYMDPNNNEQLVSKEAINYWKQVDFYVGGSEHATGHLIYSRFFNKFLFDTGLAATQEPFKKLFNQGMIQGRSSFVYRVKGTNKFVSLGLKDKYETTPIHVDVNIVENDTLDLEAFKEWRAEYQDAEFELEDGSYICGHAVEKMSKSLYNVVNPDIIVNKYGADTLRLFEMFLGPIEQAKPWNTSSIEGVSRFLKKVWALCFDLDDNLMIVDEKEGPEELKVLHTAIKSLGEAIETFSLNTGVSSLMIFMNDISKLKCKKKSIIEPFLVLLSPYAPHLTQEIWEKLGNKDLIVDQEFPKLVEGHLIESAFSYPVSMNGKLKFLKDMPLDLSKADIEKEVLADERTAAALAGKAIKKMIVVPKKIVNIVV